MIHPSPEQWMDYLYGELPMPQQTEFGRHLESCAACQAQVAEWRGAKAALDAWKLPKIQARPQAPFASGYWRWAAAAVLLIGVGLGLGHFTAPAPDLTTIRAQLELQLRQQLKKDVVAMTAGYRAETQQALAALAEALEAQRLNDNQAFLKLLQEQDANQQLDLAALRRDLETVAVMTDGSLRNARDQIVRLAALAQAGGPPGSPK